MSGGVRFYYDFSSPFAYLGATQIERVAGEHGVYWRPILVGALFQRIGTPMVPLETFPAAKRAYIGRDLAHWADHWGVPFRWPSRFPMRTVLALRLALAAAEQGSAAEVSRALFRAYWVDDRDLNDPEVVRSVAADCGLLSAFERAQSDPAIKQALFDSTDEAVQAGVVGVPSFVVRGHVFWGQDRLDLVARALEGWEPPTL